MRQHGSSIGLPVNYKTYREEDDRNRQALQGLQSMRAELEQRDTEISQLRLNIAEQEKAALEMGNKMKAELEQKDAEIYGGRGRTGDVPTLLVSPLLGCDAQ